MGFLLALAQLATKHEIKVLRIRFIWKITKTTKQRIRFSLWKKHYNIGPETYEKTNNPENHNFEEEEAIVNRH